jgi:Holliday junction resolvasome RuvABC ATP-dependent DNA helicase subunit
MIGMQSLKRSILDQLLYFMQGLHQGKDANSGDFKHTALFGPPGTGKTEIAKIIGQMYSKIGILKNSVFKKVTRNDMVAGYLGQTAIKTKTLINECLGGVLFIDEAYSLSNAQSDLDNYSKECIDTLCEALSDHKHDLMVIVAGYEDEMRANFFGANQGLESRFIWRFTIDKYSPTELREIFMKKVDEAGWKIEGEEGCPKAWFEKNKDKFRFYGRDMELLFFYTKICHSKRVFGKDPELKKKIAREDLEGGLQMFLKNKTKENETQKYLISSMYV